MKQFFKFTGAAAVLAVLPSVASAQADLQNIIDLIGTIGDILNYIIPLIVTLALIYFFWGLAQFIVNSGDDGARTEGRNKMIWGIVALFVIVSVWGLVGFLQKAFGFNSKNDDRAIEIPIVPGTGSDDVN